MRIVPVNKQVSRIFAFNGKKKKYVLQTAAHQNVF